MRRYSSSRSLSDATSMKPIGANPVAWPVSASRRLKRAREYLRISVEVSEVEPKVTMRPAACQVVPEVSRSRSSRTMSFQPIRARWYATEVPMTPPPTTTTRAWPGILAGDELAAVTANGCPAQKRDLGIILFPTGARLALRELWLSSFQLGRLDLKREALQAGARPLNKGDRMLPYLVAAFIAAVLSTPTDARITPFPASFNTQVVQTNG